MENIIAPAPKANISTYVTTQSLRILENVIQFCKIETANDKLMAAGGRLDPYLLRASCYTGVPIKVIEKVEETTIKCPKIDLSLRLAINKNLKTLFSLEKEPTSKLVYDMLKAQQYPVPNYKGFRIQLVELGYENIQLVNGRLMIIENPKFTFERYRYIKKITKARIMKNKIYYLGVRIYDNGKKCMMPINSDYLFNLTPMSDCLILYHLISKDGYENGFFSYSFETDNFIKWVLHILVPMLKPSSFIVIDNNPLYGSPEKQYISRYHSKKDMIKWLKNHNLPCNPSMHKAELFELIDKCSANLDNNNLENVLKSFGHDVIRLPPHIHDLTPTELLWKDVNDKLKISINEGKIITMNNIAVKEYITDIIDSLKKWNMYDQEIKKAEESFLALDNELENYLDKYDISLDSVICEGDKKWHHITLV